VSSLTKIVIAFYGDDFTGSTDALEFITRAGAKAVLFTETPTAEQLAAIPGLNVYGVAGKTRALSPNEMEKILLPAFEQMKAAGARHIHYKICSTFDSSISTGSIGKAIDCGAIVFKNNYVPVLGGMPALGRYCLFGNLFAKMGIGSEGAVYRLDRHPSMSKHPVTPATESDLTKLLASQTTRKIGLVDILKVSGSRGDMNQAVNNLVAQNTEVLVFDALTNEDLMSIGEHLDTEALQNGQPLFSVGSSGIEMGLGSYWNRNHLFNPVKEWPLITKADPLLVVSGSCSPVTSAQIGYAKANGFEEIIIDAVKICNDDTMDGKQVATIIEKLQQKKNLVVHTGDNNGAVLSSEKLGTALGTIAKKAVLRAGIKRIVVAGGDTSSYAARAMEIDAVEMLAPLVSGAPLCKVYSGNELMNGLEVNFKGGQVGGKEYFLKVSGQF
jgi:3-oxoisoapionate kinase